MESWHPSERCQGFALPGRIQMHPVGRQEDHTVAKAGPRRRSGHVPSGRRGAGPVLVGRQILDGTVVCCGEAAWAAPVSGTEGCKQSCEDGVHRPPPHAAVVRPDHRCLGRYPSRPGRSHMLGSRPTPRGQTVRTGRLSDGSAVGVVVSESQNEAAFIADSLPAPPKGKDYELWYAEKSDDLRPAGLLPPAEDRSARLLACRSFG
ncbi:anti-sigma factor domain-containing protein [Streptomyces sp. NBC_01474]|uniref:anti-sigma factor domain-containing protein n=1 Tax=Streptomyces sp. NBC_01474 TaxID=2903880 RepID=UPI003FA35090